VTRPPRRSHTDRVRRLTAVPGTIQKLEALHLVQPQQQASEEDGMTTTRFSSAVRRALRALDTWTLDVFNPRYPTVRD
jgi:hypothetical protein